MAHGVRNIDPGNTPSAPIAIDLVSGQEFQRVKFADATEGSNSPIGVDANPLRVKSRRAGTSDYDSGLVTVATGSPALVTNTTIYPEQGFISNTSSSQRQVTLQNLAGSTFFDELVAPQNTVPFPCGGSIVGLKAGASGAGVVLSVFGGQ